MPAILGITERVQGRIEAVISALFFAVMCFFVKRSSHTPAQCGMIRGAGNCLIALAHSQVTKDDMFGSWNEHRILIKRGFLGMVALTLMIQGNKLLDISVFTILVGFNVFGVILFNVAYLGAQFKMISVYLALLSFFGTSLVLAPTMYGFSSAEGQHTLDFKGTSTEYLGLAFTAGFVVMNSFIRTFLAKVAKSVLPMRTVLFLNFILGSFEGALSIWNPFEWRLSEIPNYLGIAFFSYFYQILYMSAMRKEPDPNTIVVLQSLQIVFTMMLDSWLLGTSLSAINIVGALIVALGTVLAAIKK